MTQFVFFHVGDDIAQPDLLARSIRASNPAAEIIMCSDAETPPISDVDRRVDLPCDRERIMTSRIRAFGELDLTEPAVYLDTDMLVISPLDAAQALGSRAAILCRRSFNRGAAFNIHFRGMDYSEYAGKSLDEVYPLLACFTISRDCEFWKELLATCDTMDDKYRRWYGDQEALKIWQANCDPSQVAFAHEQDVACLPEYANPGKRPIAMHFKGPQRKPLMTTWGQKMGLIS